jgi:hypothetical protein
VSEILKLLTKKADPQVRSQMIFQWQKINSCHFFIGEINQQRLADLNVNKKIFFSG